MNTKATIQKILFIIFWICIGGGMLTLLIAAIGKKKKEVCSNYSISIKSPNENHFVDEQTITTLLKAALGTEVKGRKINEIDLDQLEQLLRDNIWISDAEMWFDNQSVLRVSVIERDPVARIFTTDGDSYYIDSSLVRLPLSEKVSAKLPVFTSFPGQETLAKKDSSLLLDVKNMAMYILKDSFLMSQVSQIDIVNGENFEMIPLVGDHLVKLGDGKNIDRKFKRLMTFYKQVLSKSGFNAYRIVDVQYAGQVIGTKPGKEKREVDMVKLRVNVENLLNKVQKMQDDSTPELKQANDKPAIIEKQMSVIKTDLNNIPVPSTGPNTVKATSIPLKNEEKADETKPKAVMPKKKENDERENKK